MNSNLKIFVSGVSGIVGYGIVKSLKESGYNLHITGGSIYENHIGSVICDDFVKVPKTSSPDYIHWFKEFFSNNTFDLLIPGIEDDMKAWNKLRNDFKNLRFLLNNESLINLCSDKWIFFQKLESLDINCRIESIIDQHYEYLLEKFGKQFIAKPRDGYGSKGFSLINCQEEFEKANSNLGDKILYQKYIPEHEGEYTCSVFFDSHGKQRSKIAFLRKLSKDGYTDYAETVDFSIFQEPIDLLSKHFQPLGPTNFQFRLLRGRPYLLEINPRISSSTSIKSAFGHNESKMSIDHFLLNQDIDDCNILNGKSYRYVEDLNIYEQ